MNTGGGEVLLRSLHGRIGAWLFALAVLCLWAGESWALSGTCVASSVNLRGDPSLSAPKVGRLGKGEFVEVRKFWKVKTEGKEFIEALMIRDVQVRMDSGRVVKLHKGLGVKCRTDYTGNNGVVRFRVGSAEGYVELSRQYWKPMDGKWFYVRGAKGGEGWVYHEFILLH